ncbi:MAG: N-acetylmuramoyl-L-alanine amidase [Sarcina sp.]
MTREKESKINPGDIVSGGFTFDNNTTVSGDFLTLRDENGNPIAGRTVSDGDRMTVLSVIQEKKLALVQYPTSSGVRQGYVTNAINVIKYDNLEKWTNGSTTEYVYSAETGSDRIGSLSPGEKATVLYKKGNRYNVVYNTSSGVRSKSGFVDYHGGTNTGESTGAGVQPGDIVPGGFTYANNAIIENDFLYLRDANGSQIAGRTVSVGDKITVLDISYSKQLALVQYPTSSGVRQGYVTNSTNIIKYLNPYNWYNGSTSETVYLDATGSTTFGTLNPYEAATLLYKKDNRYHIVYDTSKGMLTKSGYVNFKGLDAPASNITIPNISLNGVEKIQYGTSGNGRPLNAYKIGNGSKILFAGFAIHGFEDNWFRDGEALVKIATELVHKFAGYNQTNGMHGWSVYIGQCMNPDGVIQGVTNNGPGRCAVASGIDLNRSFPTGFVVRTDSRYKTGPSPLGAIEALALKNFISDLHSKASEMVVIDGHGWLNCTYGNSTIASYFTRQFGISHNGVAGGGFFTRWAESLSNTRAILLEYPSSTRSYNDVLNGNYIGKTYNAMLNIIRDNPGTGGGSGSGNGEEEFYKNAEVKAGTTSVNIRKGPSTNTEILGTLAGGAKLDISRRVKPSGDNFYWYRIVFKGEYAYIREDFVTINAGGAGNGNTGNIGKVFIDPGHGGTDPGASDLVVEREVVLEISRRLGDILKSKGIAVEYSRTSNSTTVGLSERANKANSWGADLFISIHANSFSSPVSGTETYVYTSPSQSSKDLATKIVNSISSDMGLSNRGMKQANFTVLREAAMPAVLVETAFVNHSSDADKLRNNPSGFANAIANVILGFTTGDSTGGGSGSGGSGTDGNYDSNENYHRVIELRKPFMSGADVKKVQSKLKVIGLDVGSIDGIYGYDTEDQVIKFRKSKGLSVDGKVGPATWDALMNNSTDGGSDNGYYDPDATYHRPLKYTTPLMKGADVKKVQSKLNEKISSGLSVDGSFGQGTETSVRTFQ